MSPHQSFIHQGQSRPSFSSTSHSNSNQKTRKPFFMPYLSHDAVARGLSAGELIKVMHNTALISPKISCDGLSFPTPWVFRIATLIGV